MSGKRPSEVEDLAKALADAFFIDGVIDADRRVATRVLASDWLAAHDAQVRADRDRNWRAAIKRLADEMGCEPLSNRLDDAVHIRFCATCIRAEQVRALAPGVAGEGQE